MNVNNLQHMRRFVFFSMTIIGTFRAILIITSVFLVFLPRPTDNKEFPTYRVVIDPGHGGVCLRPMSRHGDRYDLISKTYLDNFKEGASRGGLHEHIIMRQIAVKVERLLAHCAPGGDIKKFYAILKKYTDSNPERIAIITSLSRGESISEEQAAKTGDPNGPFRLFDFPDEHDDMAPGRLSRINALRPHLVVSLHMADSAPVDYLGMNPVVVPPYDFLAMGLSYLKGEIKSNDFFRRSHYSDWFNESSGRSNFEWFLNDVSMYFTGYPLNKNRETNVDKFMGNRYNMIQWGYADPPGWEGIARRHLPGTRYAQSSRDFIPRGRFWDREQCRYEQYRRGEGEEGFGGDNAYASYEIIRYMLYSLYLNKQHHPQQRPGKSYVSTWIVPLHLNAINAFIELGYLRRYRDRYILTSLQNEIAEGIAVGIYSLLAGLTLRDKSFPYCPKGKRIDFEKYGFPLEGNYFDRVMDKNNLMTCPE